MRMIFVEDDPLNRRVVRDMLKVVNIEMDEAEDGETGLKKIAEGAFDIILMDLRMPGMDGLTAIKLLRQMPAPVGQTPVIVITADTATDLKARCQEAGANDVIVKPVALNALIDAIGRIAAANLHGDILLD
jgi:CheY-like chemotaxis protein